jgi:hypothetical protein
MTDAEWFEAAEAHAKTAYGFGEMVGEFAEWFADDCARGVDPVESVEAFAKKYDLTPLDNWTLEKANDLMQRFR